jgi:sec-independent protein translocase protein TatA
MNVFGIGLPEMAVIAAIGLLVFGPKRLPELGKTLGKTLRGFQSASQEFEKEFRQAVTPEPEISGTPEPEISGAQAAASATAMSSSSLPASDEFAVLPVSVPTTDPSTQAISTVSPSTWAPAPGSELASGSIQAPVAGDTPGI